MKRYNLPTRKECLAIIKEHQVPPHIVKHSMVVAKLAVFLAQRLKEKGIAVNVELLDRACLLHDIARVCDFKKSDSGSLWQHLRAKFKGIPHEYAGYEILKDKYPALAMTVKKHRYMALLNEKERPATWEEKLLYYADKRVMHDRIVPLKERLAEGHKRNVHLHGTKAQSKINTAKVDPLIFELEEEIFNKISLNPTEITDEFINSYRKTDNRANRPDNPRVV